MSMLSETSAQSLRRNSLLAHLSAEEMDSVAPHFHRATFVPRQVIQEPIREMPPELKKVVGEMK